MRVAHSLLWKHSLVRHKFAMKVMLVEHQAKRIAQLEEMMDAIYNAHNNYCALVDKMGGESAKLHGDVGSPRARIMKPFSKVTIQRKTARLNTVRPHIDMSKLRTSFADRASLVEVDSGGTTSGGNLWIKNMEMNLQTQTNYNRGLQAGLAENEEELKQTQQFLDTLQAQICRAHRQERERWQRFFEVFQCNCERELLRKQDEVAQLNQLLGSWITKFMALQEQVGIPSGPGHHRRTLSKQYEVELKQLCEVTSKSTVGNGDSIQKVRMMASHSPLHSTKTSAPRGVSMPTQVSAGDTPPQIDDDDL